jgi:hypothetical protein
MRATARIMLHERAITLWRQSIESSYLEDGFKWCSRAPPDTCRFPVTASTKRGAISPIGAREMWLALFDSEAILTGKH